MAIKEHISLEGVEDVKKSLSDLGAAGEHALGQFRDLGSQAAASGLGDASNRFRELGRSAGEGESGIRRFREALHVLRPILQEAGVATGGFGEFAIAARAGVVGLAVAIVGSLGAAFAKLVENTDLAKNKIADMLGSTAAGKQANDQLERSAERLGTTYKDLIPTFSSVQRSIQDFSSIRFISPTGNSAFAGFVDPRAIQTTEQLFSLFRLGRASFAETSKGAEEFAKSIEKTGTVTGDALKPIREQFPAAFEALKNAFGAAGQSDKVFIDAMNANPAPVQRLLSVLATLQLQIPKTFDPKAPQGMGDAISKLFSDIKSHLDQSDLGRSLAEDITKAIAALGPVVNFITDMFFTSARFFIDTWKDVLALVAAINQVFTTGNIAPVFEAIGNLASNMFKKYSDLFTQLTGVVVGPFWETLISTAQAAWDKVLSIFKSAPTFEEVRAAAQDAWDNIKATAQAAWDVLKSNAQSALSGIWDGLTSSFQSAIDSLIGKWQAFVAFVKNNIPFLGGGASGPLQETGGGFAGGGFVRGPGSSTSDSILAWLSNSEFVVKAAAVRHYGVDMMNAINSMRLPKDFFRGFSLGGMVLPPFPTGPRFAQGGLAVAGQSRSLTLVIDGRGFAMSGQKTVIDELERAADLHNISRMGRAPGWVR